MQSTHWTFKLALCTMASGEGMAQAEHREALIEPGVAQDAPDTEGANGGEAEKPLSKNQMKKRAKFARYAQALTTPPHPCHLSDPCISAVRGAKTVIYDWRRRRIGFLSLHGGHTCRACPRHRLLAIEHMPGV